jgi:hypothetical protein
MYNLGDTDPLYHKAGNVAFMVDNPKDLIASCIRIRSILAASKGAEPIVMPTESQSRYLSDIHGAIENEIDMAFRLNRPLGMVDTEYLIKVDPDTRMSIRKSAQIIDDLLSDDKKRNDKAVKAMKAVLLINR